MKKQFGSRLLSAVLTLALLVGLIPAISTPAKAYNLENAPAATAEQLASMEKTFSMNENGGGLRVINGKLYVWGSNAAYGLGMPDIGPEAVIESPTMNPYAFDGDVIQVVGKNSIGFALTDKGKFYSWCGGGSAAEYFDTVLQETPYELDTSHVTGKLIEFSADNVGVYAISDDGTSYFAGISTYMQLTTMPSPQHSHVFYPVREDFIDQFQESYNPDHALTDGEDVSHKVEDETQRTGGANRRTIKMAHISGWHCGLGIVTQTHNVVDGLWAYSGYGQVFQPDGQGLNKVLEVESTPALMKANGLLPETARYVTGYGAVVDKKGNVWAATYGNTSMLGADYYVPKKIYDAQEMGAKAIRVFVNAAIFAILAEDNSVYAVGANVGQFIDPSQPGGTIILEPKQVFAAQSQAETITGVFASSSGVMVVTKSGNMYFAGDNRQGAAGNGSTSNSETPGEVVESKPATIPPVEPFTKNEISYEIQMTSGTSSGKIYATDDDGNLIETSTVDGKTQSKRIDSMTIPAGSKFKLNVYFEDFAKITGFVVPIRFDPTYVKVINGAGNVYPDSLSTPGAIGTSTGIVREFSTREWSGGYLLAEGDGAGGSYPKICNGGGWVSVSGHSLDQNAKIEGRVKMFSISFAVVGYTGSSITTTFDIATESNGLSSTSASIPKYDQTGMEDFDHGAGWIIPNPNPSGRAGNYQFHTGLMPFPEFYTEITYAESISLSVGKSDNTVLQKETVTLGTEEIQPSLVPSGNTNETYIVKSTANPANTSFPDVTWTAQLVSWETTTPGSTGTPDLTDVINIMSQKGTSLNFKLNSDIDVNCTAIIQFTATTVQLQKGNVRKSADLYIIIRSVEGPDDIIINEKASLTDATYIFTETSQTGKFTAGFPTAKAGFANTAVTWRLLDQSGNEVTQGSDVAAYLGTATGASGAVGDPNDSFVPPSVEVIPCHTTPDGAYLTLRVESVYDSSVYDEIKILVHLKATALNFKQEMLRLPTNTSRDLNSLLQISPINDYYEVDLEWEYTAATDGSVYSTLDTSGNVSAGADPTPTGLYETVKVTDKISGLSASIKVQVLKLESPVMPNHVEVFNVVGDKGDYVIIKGLKVGDKLTFYRDFSEDCEETISFDALTARQFDADGNCTLTLQEFLYGAGGEFGLRLYRDLMDGETVLEKSHAYDMIPVNYDPEPSKVYGFVTLAGKNTGSARLKGVAVQLTGVSNPDVVYTDENGYFEFKTYIAPGTYTLSLYQDNYLRRIIRPDPATGYAGLVIPSADEFAISTDQDPITLYPGDLNNDGAVNATDVNQYVRNWVGKIWTSENQNSFTHFDFYDGAYEVIDLNDLDMVARFNGWTRESYPKWTVPVVR